MRVLLVEPLYRRQRARASSGASSGQDSKRDDSTLWYPPLGLMKLSTFHKARGDEVRFVRGCDPTVFSPGDLFTPEDLWDRVYITTLFTYHFDQIVETIKFYLDAVGGTISKIYVGGIMAALMPEAVFEETGVYPICGVLSSPQLIDLPGDTNIDALHPDYDLLDSAEYAINDTMYAYTTRGCKNACPWCGVPTLEPAYVPYIDIKPALTELRKRHGDMACLRLMDNNAAASPQLSKIVADLLELGFGRGSFTDTYPKKQRVVDFNQGLDATHLTEKNVRILSQLNIRPMRIAFDRLSEKDAYVAAIELAHRCGFPEFSNYMLYNYKDTPRDLYERLCVNIDLNERWLSDMPGRVAGKIYSYPMRYAPITDEDGDVANRSRDASMRDPSHKRNWLKRPAWTKRFIRNIEIMKGAVHGAISPTATLARRTIGESFEEFLANLYMPEELLRYRNRHEKKVYPHEPKRKPGTGKVEEFRAFVLALLKKQDKRFMEFHTAVSPNRLAAIQDALRTEKDPELREWLKWYLKRK